MSLRNRLLSFRLSGLLLLVVVPLLLTMSACSLFMRADKPSFPHDRHFGVPCKRCHQANAQGQMNLAPPAKTCLFCHKQNTPKYVAHLGPKPRYQSFDRHLVFSHNTHKTRVPGSTEKQKCGTCHGGIATRKGGRAVPPMATCLSCHNHKSEYNTINCKKCHTNLRRFPVKPLSDYKHTPNFVRTHKRYAKGRLDLCTQCHDQPYCARCHDPTLPVKPSLRFPEQVVQGMMHRGDYTTRHAREARLHPTTCKRCHGPSGCEACHQRNAQLMGKRSKRSPHPAGYVRRGGIAFHGRDARRDPSRCQSCHDQGPRSNCVNCHRVGGFGGNPHPPGWRFSNRLNAKTNGMCRYCHTSVR